MEYRSIDPQARADQMASVTGLGDTSRLTMHDALLAERQFVVTKLRFHFMVAHAAAADPNAESMESQAAQLQPLVSEAEAARDRIVAITGTDVSEVAPVILAVNREKAEQDHFDAEWRIENVPDLEQREVDALRLMAERAEREIGAIDTWGDSL